MRHLLLVAVACSAAVPAQSKFDARHWLPSEYQNVVHVDFAALRERGIWDELYSGLMKVTLQSLEREAGFPLVHLDRLTMIAEPPRTEGGVTRRTRDVLVLEGNAPLAVPDRIKGSPYWHAAEVGKYEVMQRETSGSEVFFQPNPAVQVRGSTELLQPMLDGVPSAGMPCPDIMSLLSGPDGELLYFVLHLENELLRRRIVRSMFPGTEWPEGERPQYLMVRLLASGDEDDPRLVAEAVMRHGTAGEGVAITEQAVNAFLKRSGQDPQLRLLAPVFAAAEPVTDRTDVTVRVDLGRAREATGKIAMLAIPILGRSSAKPVPGTAPPPAREEKKEAGK